MRMELGRREAGALRRLERLAGLREPAELDPEAHQRRPGVGTPIVEAHRVGEVALGLGDVAGARRRPALRDQRAGIAADEPGEPGIE